MLNLWVIKISHRCKGSDTINTIKELISGAVLFVRTLQAMCAELEEQDRRIKALEENRKMKDKTISNLMQEVAMLKLQLRKKVNEDA